MTNKQKETARRLLGRDYGRLEVIERGVVKRLAEGRHISRNVNREFEDTRTFDQRVADRLASFGGSWSFIFLFLVLLTAWIGINTVFLLDGKPFDPFPFILLNLVLSMLAALQAPVILLSQNRHNDRDRLQATHDYEVNLKAELEIRDLARKIDRMEALLTRRRR